MTSQRFECEICKIYIRRESMQKHLRSRKRIRTENIRNVIKQLRNQQSVELLPGNNIILK